MNFGFVYNYRHIYQKWVLLVDSKCRKHCNSYKMKYSLSRRVFHDILANSGEKRSIMGWSSVGKMRRFHSLVDNHTFINPSFIYIIQHCLWNSILVALIIVSLDESWGYLGYIFFWLYTDILKKHSASLFKQYGDIKTGRYSTI